MGGNLTKEGLYSAIDASDEKLIEEIIKVKIHTFLIFHIFDL